MITSAQLKAARALLGKSQKQLAEAAGISLPTVQRMEQSAGTVRSNVDTLVKVVTVLEGMGIVLIKDGEFSGGGGRGVRLS